MSPELAHAVRRLASALRRYFPFYGDPEVSEPELHPLQRQVNFSRLLRDLPEEEARDQELLTGEVLRPGAPEIRGVVGPLREVDRLLQEQQGEATPRLQQLRILFSELLESRAYYWFTTAPYSLLRGHLFPQDPILLDDLRRTATEATNGDSGSTEDPTAYRPMSEFLSEADGDFPDISAIDRVLKKHNWIRQREASRHPRGGLDEVPRAAQGGERKGGRKPFRGRNQEGRGGSQEEKEPELARLYFSRTSAPPGFFQGFSWQSTTSYFIFSIFAT
jgi:hypothetical protein